MNAVTGAPSSEFLSYLANNHTDVAIVTRMLLSGSFVSNNITNQLVIKGFAEQLTDGYGVASMCFTSAETRLGFTMEYNIGHYITLSRIGTNEEVLFYCCDNE